MNIDEKIRQGVVESLPEASQIKDEELREKVYDAWAISLSESGYSKLEEIPNSGTPDTNIAKTGTQADHLRGVARIAAALATEFKNTFEGFNVDMDEVIARASAWINDWLRMNLETRPGLSGNIFAMTDTSGKLLHIYFVPRDKELGHSPRMAGMVGSLEILGELVLTTENEKRDLDWGKVDYRSIARILSDISVPL